jgi:hypothetical protein
MHICRILVNAEKYLDIYCWGLLTMAAVVLLTENYRMELHRLLTLPPHLHCRNYLGVPNSCCRLHFCSEVSNRDSKSWLVLEYMTILTLSHVFVEVVKQR